MAPIKKRFCAAMAAVVISAFLLASCGPEPGREGAQNTDPLMAAADQERDKAEAADLSEAETPQVSAAGENAGAVPAGEETAGSAQSAPASGPAEEIAAASAATASAAAASSSAAGAAAGVENVWTDPVRLGKEELQELENYFNDMSCYGFLLSSYERPEDIDLEQVFYSGAGYPLERLGEEEVRAFLGKREQATSIIKVTGEQVDELLLRRAGITMKESNHPLQWAYLEQYHAYYSMHGDTNGRVVHCTDGWRQGDTLVVHYQEKERSPEGGRTSAYYRPTYEVVLRASGEEYLFCSNVFWVQKDLIEAQSYKAELEPFGEVFFVPLYPDTEADPKADVSFGIVQNGGLVRILKEMETGNVRKDRIFTGVDAVDFTDYNRDGYPDILTVCSYHKTDQSGAAKELVREVRVYDGRKDGIPVLNQDKTREVNQHVDKPGITTVTEYLTGQYNGKSGRWDSWKEAYADHLQRLEQNEYKGYALIKLEEGRTPAFVQVGATSEKGATIVIYKSGALEETWLNRQTFRYLEHENLLYCASGIENLYYDTVYSVSGGRLRVSTQGHYGNRNFARVQTDKDGNPVYQYFWDGGEVSRDGYRDGLSFVFDDSRAVTCGEEDLLTAEEMLEKLKN